MVLSSFTKFHRRKRRPHRPRKREGRSACWMLALLVVMTDVLLLLMVLYFADDGSRSIDSLNSGAEKATGMVCSHVEQRLKTAELLRPRFEAPLDRGPGTILLGLASPERSTVDAIVRAASLRAQKKVPSLACCRGREWNFELRVHRQTVYHSAAWPLQVWTEPTRYHPFLFAAVPSAKSRAILVVQNPVERLTRALRPSSIESLLRLCNASSSSKKRRDLFDVASKQLVRAPSNRCFSLVFHQRLLALARGSWLPFVLERFEESLVVIARAYGWETTSILPPKLSPTTTQTPILSEAERQIIANAQPYDQKLYDLANNALSAWQAKLGKEFSAQLRDMREAHQNWKLLCNATNHSISTSSTKMPPNQVVCDWLEAKTTTISSPTRLRPTTRRRISASASSEAAWAKPPCTFDPIWSAWCAVAS